MSRILFAPIIYVLVPAVLCLLCYGLLNFPFGLTPTAATCIAAIYLYHVLRSLRDHGASFRASKYSLRQKDTFRFGSLSLVLFSLPLVAALTVFNATSHHAVALLTAVPVFFLGSELMRVLVSDSVLQGTTILDLKAAAKKAFSVLPKGDAGLFWGGARLRTDSANTHFLLLGLPGTGKTTCFRFLMQSLLPTVKPGSDRRAVIFDAKTETYPQLMSLNLEAPVRILNPFDARSVSWNIAADVTDSATAHELAAIFVPDERNASGSSAFFTNAARALVAGVMKAFIKTAPGEWTFADVIHALDDPERLKVVLSSTPTTATLINRFCVKESTFQDVFSTVATKLEHFKPVAAIWKSDTGEQFSLREWMQGEGILLLGNDKTRDATIRPLNQAFFHIITKLILAPSQTPSATRRTYIFLDELPQAGRLNGLNDIQTNGRSYGASLVLGFQSRDALCKPGLYSKEEAAEIIEQCNHRAVFRVNDNTAKWAAENVIGTKLEVEESYNENSHGTGTNQAPKQRLAVLPSDFAKLKDLQNSSLMHGYYSSAAIGVWTSCLRARDVFSKLTLPSEDPDHAAYVERSYIYQDENWLAWLDKDERRLSLGLFADGEPRNPLASAIPLLRRVTRKHLLLPPPSEIGI